MIDASLLNITWILLCSTLVMLMQAGFCCLESGLCRSKNNINVALKNLMDFCICGLVFWAIGFWLMFGNSDKGFIGNLQWPIGDDATPHQLAFFLFQLTFAGTSVTIISGAVAERLRFNAYIMITLVISILVYPVIGHWCWGGAFDSTNPGWLQKMGFVDFAGSTVVHSVGGWVSLAALIIIGPRKGRFGPNAKPIQGSNVPMAILGVMILWFGWFGFNAGSTLEINNSIPRIMVNTSLAAASGSCTLLLICILGKTQPTVDKMINGVVAGLVAITASCHVVSPFSAIIIGAVGGIVCLTVTTLLIRARIDDVIGAVPAHAGAGVWGTLAVALFGNSELIGTNLSWTHQLIIQIAGIASTFVWAFGIGFVALLIINRITPLRVSSKDEIRGLNVAEHGASSELFDLMSQMNHHRTTGDFTQGVQVDPNSEIGRIGLQYNSVLERINQDQRVMQTAAREIAKMNHELMDSKNNAQKESDIKSHFLTHLQHEIRRPVNTIKNHNEQIQQRLTQDPQSLHYADQIADDSEHLLNLVDDIGCITDINSGNFHLSKTTFAIRDLIEEVCNHHRPLAHKKQIEMQSLLGPNVPLMVYADKERLRQILDHLIKNAVQFTEQGYVHIVTRTIPQGEYDIILRINVEDSGPGIPSEIQESLFDPFTKAHQNTNHSGTGMGLAISRRLAIAMSGNLTVGSEPGQGSIFSLTFVTHSSRPIAPLPNPQMNDSGELDTSNIDMTGRRILYIEDQYEQQKLIQQILGTVGAKVDCADNGKIGMEIALAANKIDRPYDLILMDVHMPIMDGLTATEKLREAGFSKPIIMLSGYVSYKDKDRCLKIGANSLITKPVKPDMLLRMTYQFMKKQMAL